MDRALMNRVSRALTERGCRYGDVVYFLERLEQRPWTAVAPKTVKPTSVPGNHVSVATKNGRVWGFESMQERDDFVAHRGGSAFP